MGTSRISRRITERTLLFKQHYCPSTRDHLNYGLAEGGPMFLFKPNIRKLERNRDIPALIAALSHKNDNVSDEAGRALVRIGEPVVEPICNLIESNPGHHSTLASILDRIGDPRSVRAFSILLKRLGTRDQYTFVGRSMLAEAIMKHGLPEDPEVRALVAVAACDWPLAQSVGSVAIEPLMLRFHASKGSNAERVAITRVIGEIGGPRAVQALCQIAREESGGNVITFSEATKWLGKIGGDVAISCLIGLLSVRHTVVGSFVDSAVEALGETRDQRAVEPLRSLMKTIVPTSSLDLACVQEDLAYVQEKIEEALKKIAQGKAPSNI